jgi:hypothetical protein
MYQNKEAVCAPLFGGGYGSGDGGAVGPSRIDPDSNGNSDSDLEDEMYIELIQTLISNREIRISINREDLELDIKDIDLYAYREDNNALYLLFVPISRRSEIEVDAELEILYSYSERDNGFIYVG